MGRLLNPREAAEQAGVHRSTVIYWIHTGQLEAAKLGRRHWYIDEEDLQHFQQQREAKRL